VRDVVLSRVPAIFEREIYASAALVGAAVQVALSYAGWTQWRTLWFATVVCIFVRLASLYFGWRLPSFREKRVTRAPDVHDGQPLEGSD
jgi:uncharacterized membrane protein YeiH